MNSSDQPQSSRSSKLTLIILFFALLVIGFAYIKLGFVLSFWIIFVLWIIFILYYFLSKIIQGIIIRIFLILIIVISVLITFGLIPGLNNQTATPNSTNQFNLVDCTSTTSDIPQAMTGWNASIYSGPIQESSPDPEQANNVRTFSYNGIKNKSEVNSMYAHFDKTDGSIITGFDMAMEVCDSNNKVNSVYSTFNRDASDAVKDTNVTGRTYYFHGGPYLFGPGTYRVDAYINDTNGWHLVNRLEGITVTE